jgi:GntR family transcriptional regulator
MFNSSKINPQSAMPLYVQIIDLIKEGILLEKLAPGDQLPSVRSLANDLKVNSLTIQKAYKLLASEDLIEIKKGIGAFVSENIKPVKKVSKYQIIEEKLSPIIEQAKSMELELDKVIKTIEKQWRKKND